MVEPEGIERFVSMLSHSILPFELRPRNGKIGDGEKATMKALTGGQDKNSGSNLCFIFERIPFGAQPSQNIQPRLWEVFSRLTVATKL